MALTTDHPPALRTSPVHRQPIQAFVHAQYPLLHIRGNLGGLSNTCCYKISKCNHRLAIRVYFYPSVRYGSNTDICLTPLAPLLSRLVMDLGEYSAPVLINTDLPNTKWICIDFGTAVHGAGDGG